MTLIWQEGGVSDALDHKRIRTMSDTLRKKFSRQSLRFCPWVVQQQSNFLATEYGKAKAMHPILEIEWSSVSFELTRYRFLCRLHVGPLDGFSELEELGKVIWIADMELGNQLIF